MRKIKVLALFILAVGCLSSSAQQKDSLAVKKWTIKNCVNQFNKEKSIKTDAGYQYWFADPDFLNGRTLKMSVVVPHQATHPPHKHVEDEFFFILEGQAKFYLNGDSTVCGSYTSFYCPSMLEHGIRNAGSTELKYIVIKDYKSKPKQ